MRLTTARQVWTNVFRFEVSQGFDINLQHDSHDTPGLYCPGCRQHETLKKREVVEDGKKKVVYRCRSCGGDFKRPAVLKSRGSVKGRQSRSSVNSDDRIANGLEAGQILSVIDSLPSECKTLGMWCYTDEPTDETEVFEYIIDGLDQDCVEVNSLHGAEQVFQLVLMLMKDYRKRSMCGLAMYTDSDLAEKLGVHRSQMNSKRYWGGIKDKIIAALDDIDRRALWPISEKIEQMKG